MRAAVPIDPPSAPSRRERNGSGGTLPVMVRCGDHNNARAGDLAKRPRSGPLRRVALCCGPGCRGFESRRSPHVFALAAGAGDASVIRENDGLNTITKAELHKQASDVGLDRGFADNERGGDLGV
jgi:hypothetical protein